jgi:hypothetical protein
MGPTHIAAEPLVSHVERPMHRANGNNGKGKVTIRRLGDGDLARVVKLAELDSALAPPAPLVGVEIEGKLLAVGSIPTGKIIADPFKPTAELRELLSAALAVPW